MSKEFLFRLFVSAIIIIGMITGISLALKKQDIRKKASGDPVTLRLEPQNIHISNGQSSAVKIAINTGDYTVTAVKLHLTYDPAKIEIQSFEPGSFLARNLPLPSGVQKMGSGSLNMILGTEPQPTLSLVTNASGFLATINFRSISPESSSISFTSSSQVAAVGHDTNVLKYSDTRGLSIAVNTPVPAATIIPTSTVTPVPSNTPVPTDTLIPTSTITLIPSNSPVPTLTRVPTNTPIPTNPPGYCNIRSDCPPASNTCTYIADCLQNLCTYANRINGSACVTDGSNGSCQNGRCVLPSITPAPTFLPPTVTTIPTVIPSQIVITAVPTGGSCGRKSEGDANCDDRVTGVDFSIWLNTQCHHAPGQTCSDERADFNSDTQVDDSDYQIWFDRRNS